jgi:putative peptidoglycan lipid II flippase
VAAGILFSRIAGLLRDRVFAHYFGTSLFADAFRAALRMPNVLQNLLGEGTLSASFIPVYAGLLEKGKEGEAGRVAGAVFALLLAVAGGMALVGIALAPVLVDIFLWGFEGEKRDITVTLVRIIFPMTGILVLSAWTLGILNSHRQFFLSYVAPVAWNAAMIATLVAFGARLEQRSLVIALAWGALVGGVLQFGVQLPGVLRAERELRVAWDLGLAGVRETVRNAGPAIMGRGVVQLSGWADLILASLLADGAVAALGYATTLYALPVSLFGLSVAAAELPELSRRREGDVEVLRQRVNGGLRQIAFFVVPSVAGYVILGDVIVAALYQTGDFGANDTLFVWLVLAGYSIGLLASTAARLFSSAFFALGDTRTPAKFALVRVLLAAGLGLLLMTQFERFQLDGQPLGAAGLSLASGLAAWVEWTLLRSRAARRLGTLRAGPGAMARMLVAAGAAALAGRGVAALLPPMGPLLVAVLVLSAFGLVYFGTARLLGLSEAGFAWARITRRLRGGPA